MKKRYRILISLFATASIFCSTSLNAQQGKELCPEPKVKSGYLQQLQQWRNAPRIQSSVNQLRIYFHICTNDDGTLPGATEDQVMNEFNDMVADFEPGNICFVYAGLDYVADAGLNHINVITNDNAEEQFAAHAVSGCLNIFYCYEIKGKNTNNGGTIGGNTFETPGTLCIVRKSSIGKHTTSHETGHCLGLFHTYDSRGLGLEFINGTDCDSRGDLMCDTKADPYSFFGENCFSIDTVNNTYDGYCEDGFGNRNYDPPYHNLMSYWRNNPQSFTSDQFAAMNNVIDNDGDIQAVASAGAVTLHDISFNFGDYFRSAISSFGIFSQVEFSGGVRAGLFGSSVTILPGFHANPQIFSVTIKAAECNASSKSVVAETSSSNTSLVSKATSKNNKLNTGLSVYPNPATGYFIIKYNQSSAFDAVITIRNTTGAIIFSLQRKNITQLQEKINLTGKAKGVYFVEVMAGAKRFTEKLVLQ